MHLDHAMAQHRETVNGQGLKTPGLTGRSSADTIPLTPTARHATLREHVT